MSDTDISHRDCELVQLNGEQKGQDDEEDDEVRERSRLLKIRKKQELKLVKKFDKSAINVAKECWFLVDSDWLNKWSAFVNGGDGEDSPGPLSTKELLDAQDIPLLNLMPIRDYRGVPPIVYFIFLELYGKDSSPELCRYQIDIYKSPVSVAKLVNIQLTGRAQAKIQVNRVRPKWLKWDRGEEDEGEDQPLGWCCGLTKEHLEAFIYWAITCWSNRRRSGRGDISYRKYQPLKPDEDTMGEADSHHGYSNASASEGNSSSSSNNSGWDWLTLPQATTTEEEKGKDDTTSEPASSTTKRIKKDLQQASRSAPASSTKNINRKSKAKKNIHPNAAKQNAAAAATELARSQYFLKQTEANDLESEKVDKDNSSSDSEAEDRYIFSDGPADKGAEQGTWWYRFNR